MKRMFTDTVSPHSAGMQFAIDYYGIDHVMYGTDYPCWDPARVPQAARRASSCRTPTATADPRRRLRPRRARRRRPVCRAAGRRAAGRRGDPARRPTGTFARPGDLAEALALLAEHPDAVLVAGSTDWGVEVNIRGARTPFAIGIDRLPELRTLEIGEDVGRDRGRPQPERGRARARLAGSRCWTRCSRSSPPG